MSNYVKVSDVLDISREYIERAAEEENIDQLSTEIEWDIRNKSIVLDDEDDDWCDEEPTKKQIDFIRYWIYHKQEFLNKRAASKIIEIMQELEESVEQ